MSLDADVIVIGAGPAGCAAAIRLAAAGYDVLALERKEREDGEDHHVGRSDGRADAERMRADRR